MSSDKNIENRYSVSLVFHDHKDKKQKYRFLLRTGIVEAKSEFEAIGIFLLETIADDDECKGCSLTLFDVIKIDPLCQ